MRINLEMEDREAEYARELAIALGYTKGNGNPNFQQLVKAFIRGDLAGTAELTLAQQVSLHQLLVDGAEAGHAEAVLEVGEWLMKQPELGQLQADSLGSILNRLRSQQVIPDHTVLDSLKDYLASRQPFTLSYSDSSGKEEQFTCTYGHLEYIERHRYLVAQITEVAPNPEHLDLAFNRCFRLDRISAIVPEPQLNWGELGTVDVVFWLYGNWTRKYEPKKGDIGTSWVTSESESEPILEVRRRVWSFFWLLRELDRYEKVQVISPTEIRSRHHQMLQQKLCLYL